MFQANGKRRPLSARISARLLPLTACLAAFGLSGCAGLPQQESPATPPVKLEMTVASDSSLAAPSGLPVLPASAAQALSFSGRMSVRVDWKRDAADVQTTSGNFEWVGSPEQGQLRLTSPLGTIVAEARWSPSDGAWLKTSQSLRHFAGLGDLSRAALGEDIPIAALPDWIRGQPWSGAPASPLSEGLFEQVGWRVDTSQLAASGLLLASRSGLPEVTVRIRLDR